MRTYLKKHETVLYNCHQKGEQNKALYDHWIEMPLSEVDRDTANGTLVVSVQTLSGLGVQFDERGRAYTEPMFTPGPVTAQDEEWLRDRYGD